MGGLVSFSGNVSISNASTGPHGKAGQTIAMPAKAVPRTRRTQAERSEAMRARLSAESYRIVAEGGVRALTIRSLAAAAKVSQGAVLHHFPDKAAIVLLAIEHALTIARDESAQWQDEPGDAEAMLRAMLAEFHAFFFSDRFWVAMGITIEASKDADLFRAVRHKVGTLRTPIYQAWEDRLCTRGWTREQARQDVRAAAAMISGAAIRRFWADEDDVGQLVEDEWIIARLRAVARRKAG